MDDAIVLIRWLHVIGACVLIGTGAGIAFFMVMAHQTRQATIVAHTARIVVIADTIFTATAVVAQPVTGIALAWLLGWPLTEGWIVVSAALYILIGAFWLPVVWIQLQLRDLAQAAAAAEQELPHRYDQLYRIWFFCGFPAFVSILLIVWLMLARPSIDLGLMT